MSGTPPFDDSDDCRSADALASTALPIDATRTSAPSNVAPLKAAHGVAADSTYLPAPLRRRDPDRYEILNEHGRGGLGRVSRARDIELGRVVAIKELISRNASGEARFLREALLTARLEHPGIVPVHEAGRWPDGTPFYAMKLVAGRPLKIRIAECKTLDDRLALLDHVIAVADAIAYAHDCKIIHRDLKPSNVIVGDFGETVVIDWGLAKDLSAGDELAMEPSSYRAAAIDDLTATGVVLGTPAYMAPEQARGDEVDERADVFAIGAMLWELCSKTRVPPNDARQRDRLLRRAGIDRDLTAIITKALAPKLESRYRNAGALASDLKAFKAGARIAARQNFPTAVLGRWIRRHRNLTAAALAVVIAAIVGSIIYVRNIALERDRTDAALVSADAHRVEAEHARDDLTLRNAQLLLRGDPTAASEVLATYHGDDHSALALLRARAQGAGVAILKGNPHTARTLFARAFSDGSLITVGDHTIVRSFTTGAGQRILATDAIPQSEVAYSEARSVLAYACGAGPMCLLDAHTDQIRALPTSRVGAFAARSVAFSPNGMLLAALSGSGELLVWEITERSDATLQYHSQIDGGRAVRFGNDHVVAVATSKQIQLFQLDRQRAALTKIRKVPAFDLNNLDSSDGLVVVPTRSGVLQLIDVRTGRDHAITLCKTAVNDASVSRSGTRVAYGCQDGTAGVWDVGAKAVVSSVHLEGGVATATESSDRRYLVVGGSSGTVLVHDETTKLSTTYLGHATWITSLLAPSAGFPYFMSGDGDGELRVWPVPRASVRVMLQSSDRLGGMAFLSSNGPLVISAASSELRWISFDGTIQTSEHDMGHMLLAPSPRGDRLAAFLIDASIELWSIAPQPIRIIVKTDHDIVTMVRYLADGMSFASAGHDGRVLVWEADAQSHHEVAHIAAPIEAMSRIGESDDLIFRGADGVLWRTQRGTQARLAVNSGTISKYTVSSNGHWLVVVTARGTVQLFNLQTQRLHAQANVAGAVDILALSPDGRYLALQTRSFVYTADLASATNPVEALVGAAQPIAWDRLDVKAEFLTYSLDGAWLAMAGSDGTLWFYSIANQQWICEVLGTREVLGGYFTPDGRRFSAIDEEGRVFVADMTRVLAEVR